MEKPFERPEVFLVADAIHGGFHFGPDKYFTDGSKLYPDPRRREVGWGFCSVTAVLQRHTGAYGPVTLHNATVPVAELLAVIFFVERSFGPIHIHSGGKYVCSGKNKHGTRRTHHTLDQIAAIFYRDIRERSRSLGAKHHITSDNFYQFAMTPEIFVGQCFC